MARRKRWAPPSDKTEDGPFFRARDAGSIAGWRVHVGVRLAIRLLASLARFAKGRGVTVKTRQGLTTFGEGLEDDEIRYLCALVREGLGGVRAMG